LQKVPATDYEAHVTAIIEKLETAKIPLVILTTSILGPKQAAASQLLVEYNAILRSLAAKHGCRVADVNKAMQDARAAGKNILDDDQVQPNYEGQRLLARAVLDALGDKDVPVPKEMKIEMLPGVIRQWKLRATAVTESSLDEESLKELKPDPSRKSYQLPE